MNGATLAAMVLMSVGLVAAIVGVGLLSVPTVAGGVVVAGVGLVVGVVSGRRYERDRRR